MYQKNWFFQKFMRQVVTSAVLYLNGQNFIITTFKTHQILCLGKTKNLVCLMNIIYLSNVQKIGFSNKGTNLWDTFFIKIWAFFGMFGLLNDVILEEIWPSLCSMNHMTCEELHTQRIWFKLWNYRLWIFSDSEITSYVWSYTLSYVNSKQLFWCSVTQWYLSKHPMKTRLKLICPNWWFRQYKDFGPNWTVLYILLDFQQQKCSVPN